MLPAMLPFITTALRVGVARSINGMITAELFLAAVNLGELMKAGARTFDTASVMAVVVVVCLVGLFAQSIIATFEARFLHCHHRTRSEKRRVGKACVSMCRSRSATYH